MDGAFGTHDACEGERPGVWPEAAEPSDGVAGLALVEREKGALWRKGFRLHGRSKKMLVRLLGARETSYVEGNPQCEGVRSFGR